MHSYKEKWRFIIGISMDPWIPRIKWSSWRALNPVCSIFRSGLLFEEIWNRTSNGLLLLVMHCWSWCHHLLAPSKKTPENVCYPRCILVGSNQMKRPMRVVTSSAHGFMLQPSTPVLFLKQMLEKTRGLTLADAYQLSISHKDAKFTGLMERMPAPQHQIEGIRAFARTVAVIKGITPGFDNGSPPIALLKHGPLETWGRDWWANMSENTISYLHVTCSNAERKCYNSPSVHT